MPTASPSCMWRRGEPPTSAIDQDVLDRQSVEARTEMWTTWIERSPTGGNERAIDFYRAHGWTADGGEKFGEGGSVQGLHELRLVKDLADSAT